MYAVCDHNATLWQKWKQQVSLFPQWTENEDKESYEKSWKKLNFIVRPAEGGVECIMHTVLKVCFFACVYLCVLPALLTRFCLALIKARMSASVCWSPVSGIEDETVAEVRVLKCMNSYCDMQHSSFIALTTQQSCYSWLFVIQRFIRNR